MAAASAFLSEDQFLCSICLEIFSEPVSIPCGHNFCKDCISRHWKDKEQCQCPLCNQKFNKGLKLCINTTFRDVVENFKKHHSKADSDLTVKPGQVACDCCIGNKMKAIKTCLVCLTSYCETHLEPHQRVAALRRHKLTNPVHKLEDKICTKHNRIFELFCNNDQTFVCDLCTEHSTHDTVPLEAPYVSQRAQIVRKKAEVQEIKPKRGKKARKKKVAAQTRWKGKDKRISNSAVFNRGPAAPFGWCPFEGPNQLHRYRYLQENIGVSRGRCFFNIEVKEKSGWLGVVRESVLQQRTFKPDPMNGSWMMRFERNINRNCQFMVFVDYDGGLVSFHDAHTGALIWLYFGCEFNEKVFLFYAPTEGFSWANIQWSEKQQVILLCFVLFVMYFLCLSQDNS